MELNVYKNLKGKCYRVNHNPNSPFVNEDTIYEGLCLSLPTVGFRFRCGSLDTNIVAKIVEQTDTDYKFETLSGSLYHFTILEHGEVETIITTPTPNKKEINDYLK